MYCVWKVNEKYVFLSVENLWIYAVVGFVLTGGFVVILVCYCCCYRSRKSRRQMNHLPSNKVTISIHVSIQVRSEMDVEMTILF